MRVQFIGGGGRREIALTCPELRTSVPDPPSAVARNQFFCAGCGKPLDLSQVFRQLTTGDGASGQATQGRDPKRFPLQERPKRPPLNSTFSEKRPLLRAVFFCVSSVRGIMALATIKQGDGKTA
jgi:hypothetical protein